MCSLESYIKDSQKRDLKEEIGIGKYVIVDLPYFFNFYHCCNFVVDMTMLLC